MSSRRIQDGRKNLLSVSFVCVMVYVKAVTEVVLPPRDRARLEGMSSFPNDSSFPSKFLQIGKVSPTARAGGSVHHLGQPIHHALLVESVRTFLVGRPDNFFAHFVIAQTNGTAVWHRVEFRLSVAQDQEPVRRSFQVYIRSRRFCVSRVGIIFGF